MAISISAMLNFFYNCLIFLEPKQVLSLHSSNTHIFTFESGSQVALFLGKEAHLAPKQQITVYFSPMEAGIPEFDGKCLSEFNIVGAKENPTGGRRTAIIDSKNGVAHLGDVEDNKEYFIYVEYSTCQREPQLSLLVNGGRYKKHWYQNMRL